MNVVILDDRLTQGDIIRGHASGLGGAQALVLWLEPNAALWPSLRTWARRCGIALQIVPVRLGAIDEPGALRLSALLPLLSEAGHTVNVILQTGGQELPILEDCLARHVLNLARQVFVRWDYEETLAEHLREAQLQDQCKGLVRLQTI